MPSFRATNQDTQEVVSYDATTPDAAHLAAPWILEQVIVAEIAPEQIPPPPDPRKYGGRMALTKLEFISLFTDVEYTGLVSAARSNVALEAWIKKLDYAQPDADGYSIHLDNPTTQMGVQVLELMGLLATGRAAEILNG